MKKRFGKKNGTKLMPGHSLKWVNDLILDLKLEILFRGWIHPEITSERLDEWQTVHYHALKQGRAVEQDTPKFNPPAKHKKKDVEKPKPESLRHDIRRPRPLP